MMTHLHMTGNKLGKLAVDFVTQPLYDLDKFRSQVASLGADISVPGREEQLLALRAMLAYGLLEHCLCRRWRVNYGVDPRRNHQRVAVPYVASDTPSERSEYSHPDVLIVFTVLSYFHSGLACSDTREAVNALLRLGSLAQKAEYMLWMESAWPDMSDEERSALDDVAKLDLSSDVQVAMLQRVYHRNMATICFWLNNCVLPRETMQFPQSLICNSFNLTHCDHGDEPSSRRVMIGFSGTKDNSLLLPYPVKFQTPSHPRLMATDGHMVDLVFFKPSNRLHRFDEKIAGNKRDHILEYAVKCRTCALIDAGATMAGLCNREIAEKLLKLLTTHKQRKGTWAHTHIQTDTERHCTSESQVLIRYSYPQQ